MTENEKRLCLVVTTGETTRCMMAVMGIWSEDRHDTVGDTSRSKTRKGGYGRPQRRLFGVDERSRIDRSSHGNGDERQCQNVESSVGLPELRMEVRRINEPAAGKQHDNKSYAIVICNHLLSLRCIVKTNERK